jgi:hypothetical protein
MGAEAQCVARIDGRESVGKAYLDTNEVLFRGDFRAVIKFADIKSVTADAGALRLTTADQTLELELGPQAERWRDKILNPKSLLDKLGVKQEQSVAVIRVDDADFLTRLSALTPNYSTNLGDARYDLIFYAAETGEDLARIPELKDCLAQKGAVWVISRKGKSATVKDADVIAAGRHAGLVDVKVAAFSPTHTALKFAQPSK